ncbi:MAG: branched-chain amino acid ABC transporter permease [Burkholderiales bacterium PBB5]|nr:MAG: branched-chain amino acid ABC transporter permease [Burkholderiales bacterium PBB5]
MEALLYQVFSGLANGIIYGSVALALVMIYQATHHINFAQGEMATFSTFIAWSLIQAGWPYWAAFFATVGIAFVGGVLVQRIILRPVEKAPVLTNVIVFIGLLVIFNSVAGWLFDYTIKSFPSPFPQQSVLATRYFSAHDLGSVGVMLTVLAALWAFFRFTPVGLAMRAAALNPESARLVGIRVGWKLAVGWGLALGAYVIGTELKLTVALVLIVGTLTLWPNGLFGKNVVTRV